ncbi:MAG: nucleotidyltransferase domain-containing protein [Dehalococcoidia bacterium]
MDDSTEALLHPYVTTPPRIALDVVDALSACPAVARIALFGSLADHSHDGWSDIDVLCAVEGDDGAWQAAAALRAVVPLRWHGRFSSLPAPSGRHWPLGESVFHSVDLSYQTVEEHERVLREGLGDMAIVGREVLRRPGIASAGRPHVEVVSEDYDFTHALYAVVKAIKAYLRATGPWEAVADAMRSLDAAARARTDRPRGSDPEDVLTEARTLYTALMLERSRYGGER